MGGASGSGDEASSEDHLIFEIESAGEAGFIDDDALDLVGEPAGEGQAAGYEVAVRLRLWVLKLSPASGFAAGLNLGPPLARTSS